MTSGSGVRSATSRDRQPSSGGKQCNTSAPVASTVALFIGVRDAVIRDKQSVKELVKWATAAYSGLLKNISKTMPAKDGRRADNAAMDKELAANSKLEKYRARGLKYSVRHISPAILRRQRADRSQSKELSALIEELKQHRDLWESYLSDVKDSLGSDISPERKEDIVRQKDDKLYEVYLSIWPILQQLKNTQQGK